MSVRTYATVNKFLEDAKAFLYEKEIENGVLIGRLHMPVDLLLTVVEDEKVVFAAVRVVPPNFPPLVIITPDCSKTGNAAETFYNYLRTTTQLYKVVHLMGPVAETVKFADLFNRQGDRRLALHDKLTTHALTSTNQFVLTNPSIPGSWREATLDDLELATNWSQAFDKDAGIPQAEYQAAKQNMTKLINSHKLFFWVAPVLTLPTQVAFPSATTATTTTQSTQTSSGTSTYASPVQWSNTTSYTQFHGSSYSGLISSSYSSSYSSLASSSYSSLSSSSYAALSSSSYSAMSPSSYSSLMSSSYSSMAPSSYASLVSSSYSSLASSSYGSLASSFSPTTFSGHYGQYATAYVVGPTHQQVSGDGGSGVVTTQGPSAIAWLPVAMVALVRATENAEVIGLVYTPHEYRRRGFATKLVAAVSQRVLDSGKKYCSLLSTAANIHLYRIIGYESFGELNVFHAT